jgi:hypothetical protein
VEADVLGEGHQAALDPLHEEHQADDDGEDAAQEDGLGVQQRAVQRHRLEGDQQQRQRHHRAQLLGQAHRDIGRQQPVQVDGPQPRARRQQPFRLRIAEKATCRLWRLTAPR